MQRDNFWFDNSFGEQFKLAARVLVALIVVVWLLSWFAPPRGRFWYPWRSEVEPVEVPDVDV